MMELLSKLFDLMRHLGEVEKWKAVIDHVGHPTMYVILFLVIFAETGLVVTPFLPGDSLLFAIGALSRNVGMNLPFTVVLLIFAAVLGDAANYWIGYRVGPAVFTKETGKLLNRKHLLRAQEPRPLRVHAIDIVVVGPDRHHGLEIAPGKSVVERSLGVLGGGKERLRHGRASGSGEPILAKWGVARTVAGRSCVMQAK